MSEYKKFPIYRFSFEYQDQVPGSCAVENYTNEKMFREEQTAEQLEKWFSEYKDNFLKKIHNVYVPDNNGESKKRLRMAASKAGIIIRKPTISEVRFESWVLGWFSHETIDIGEDNLYYINSFRDYIDRIKRYNHENGDVDTWVIKDGETHSMWIDPVCLMGAEDRWRWHSLKYLKGFRADRPDHNLIIQDTDNLPCRCRYCRKRGVVTISH